MIQTRAGIRELKRRLSVYLRRVEAGGTVVITKRGRPIGRIVPWSQSAEAQLEALNQAGVIAWNGRGLQPLAPVARAEGNWMVSDLLVEDRE